MYYNNAHIKVKGLFLLIHICCSVDSHFFIKQLQQEFPTEKFIGFFYDPNIHPYSEYLLRLNDAKYSCEILGIELIEGEYDLNSWLDKVRGLENEPEKGDRCTVCFDDRLEKTALLANKLGKAKFTTTLLVSPKKSQDKLQIIGNNLVTKFNLEFIFRDYRANGGGISQSEEVKSNNLYRQDYCGCMFALTAQRNYQERLLDELMSPISKQILPNSIEQRLEFYETRDNSAIFTKEQFLNFRLLNASVTHNKKVIPSYFLTYSHLNKKSQKCKIETQKNDIFYANKDGIKFLTIATFNILAKTNYNSVLELYFNAPKFEAECKIRQMIQSFSNSNSPIIVLDEIFFDNYEIFVDSKIYTDTIVVAL